MLLHNMLSNAIKYSDVNKAQKLVLIQYTQNESEWTLVVKDNGIGIGDEHLEKVFDMFYRATELSDGTGLGLFIVKEAVEKLNGRLTLESKLGEGSVVTLTFPKVQLDEMMEK
jgi:signal transduction histidine kinase